MTFPRVADISTLLLHIEIIEVCVGDLTGQSAVLWLAVIPGKADWNYNQISMKSRTYLGSCPANSDFKKASLKLFEGKKKDDWNLNHSLPTQTTVGWSGSWLTAIQTSAAPW